jgi:hypothetical protein
LAAARVLSGVLVLPSFATGALVAAEAAEAAVAAGSVDGTILLVLMFEESKKVERNDFESGLYSIEFIVAMITLMVVLLLLIGRESTRL